MSGTTTTRNSADNEGFTKVSQRRQRNPSEDAATASPSAIAGEGKRRENGNGAERPKQRPRSTQTPKAATTNVNGNEEQQQDGAATGAPRQQGGGRGGAQWNKRGERRQGSNTAPREYRPRPSTEGGEWKRRNNSRGHKEDTRVTVFISNINIQDLTGVTSAHLAKHYVQKRVDCLIGLLSFFGTIVASEIHVSDNADDSKNYILVSYQSHDHASSAIRSLKDKSRVRDMVAQVAKNVLTSQNLPISLAPDSRWSISWSDREIVSHSSTAAAAATTTPVAEKKPKKERKEEDAAPKKAAPKPKNNPAPAAAAPVEAPAKPEKKQKKQKSAAAAAASAPVPAEPPIVAEPVPVETAPVVQVPVQPPAPQPTPSELRREAEKANLNSELQYLIQQQERIMSEIKSERDRCNDREQRIVYLTEHLQRVQIEMQQIQRQLNTEQSFKKSAEERTQKLEEELQHMKDEQVRVQAHLESIENDVLPVITRWVDAE